MHYEIHTAGETVDPMIFLSQSTGTNVAAAPSSFYTVNAPTWAGCDSRA